MYLACIHVQDERLVEGIITSALFIHTTALIRYQTKAFTKALEKGGPIKSMPITVVGKLITPLHGLPIFIPPLVYLVAVPLNGGVQPVFITRWALPDFGGEGSIVNVLRLAGCLGLLALWIPLVQCMKALGQSFHAIGVREKPKLASTGPYAIVRHPGYSLALIQELLFAIISWNAVPLYAFALCVFAFAVKIPIEEGLIESDPAIGPQYLEYKGKVRYRLVPGVW